MMPAWELRQDDGDVILLGPGRLEIILADFDPARVERPDDLGAEVLGTLIQRSWRYRIEEGMVMELISTEDTANLDRQALHMLHIGTRITWQLPDEIAEAIHVLGK